MSEFKIVIVGAGFVARVVHLPGYSGNGVPVAAICDVLQERAEGLAAQYNIPNVYGDWREMIEKEQPDIVSVCLPNVAHREVTLASFETGAHVLCEKPLATTVAEAHEMFDAARTAGRVLMAAQHMRYDAGARAIKRVIESGAVGEIYHVESTFLRRLAIPTWGAFHYKSASYGGALLDLGVHILDQALWLIDNPRPVSVAAVTQQRFGRRPEVAALLRNAWDPAAFDVEDFASAFVRFENGADLLLRASWAAHIAERQVATNMILGTEGGVTTDPPMLFHTRNGVLANETFPHLQPRNTYEDEVRAFLAACRGDMTYAVKEEETLNVQRILNAAYRSAEEGREVAVED